MTLAFAVSWDYRCPFARNAHEHLVEALKGGADWDVTFVPFSLNQVHVGEGDPDVWDDPTKASALLAMEVGIVVRDRHPDRFLDVHHALFKARHEEGRDIREEEILREILTEQGVDADKVFAEIADGWPLEQFRKEHEAAAGDAALATKTIERVVDLVGGFPELNEFKHTSIPR